MKTILLAAATVASLATAASAAPINVGGLATMETANVEQVRLVCNEYGRCFRTRAHATSNATTTTTPTSRAAATATTADRVITIAVMAPTAGRASASASAPAAGDRRVLLRRGYPDGWPLLRCPASRRFRNFTPSTANASALSWSAASRSSTNCMRAAWRALSSFADGWISV
jgi:hypothetical protein